MTNREIVRSTSETLPRFSPIADFNRLFGSRITLDAEDGTGGGDDAAAKAAAKAAEEAAAKAAKEAEEAGKNKVSDKEAELLKEVMDKKAKLKDAEDRATAAAAKLKEFEGIDPTEVKKLIQEKKDAEKASLEAKGDFERLKKMMAEEHEKEKSTIQAQVAEKDKALNSALKTINDLTVGAAFSNSAFVSGELVLTPSKARTVYGSHFEVEDGKVVAYDKPKGASDRTKLVDAAGNAIGFEDAIKKLVETDPDRDQLVKSKLKDGAGSKTSGDKAKDAGVPAAGGLSRIAAAIAAKKKA